MTQATDANSAAAFLPFIPLSARRVLDFTCGGGLAHLIASRNDVQVTAPPQAKAANEGLPGIPGQFDCIVCDGAIARRRDPKPLLLWLKARLDPEGLLILTAPNLQHFSAISMLAEGRWDYGGCAALARENLRYFTAYELVRLVRDTGLVPRKCLTWRMAAETDWPLDGEGCYRQGRLSIGPLSAEEYNAFRSEEYLVLATHTAH